MPLTPDLTTFTTASPTLTSFSYDEIISGQGIAEFFLYDAYSDTTPTTVYKISDKSSIYSNDANHTAAGTRSTSFVLIDTLTFDSSLFNDRRVAQGTATVNATHFGRGGGGYVGSGRLDVSLYHVSGATETQIGATVRTKEANGASGVTVYKTNCLTYTISKIVFKKGDFLRVKVATWAKTSNGSGDGRGGFLFDPVGRAVVGADTTQFSIKLPFDKI